MEIVKHIIAAGIHVSVACRIAPPRGSRPGRWQYYDNLMWPLLSLYLGKVEVEGPGQERQYHCSHHQQHCHQQGWWEWSGGDVVFTWLLVRTIVREVVIIDANFRWWNLSSAWRRRGPCGKLEDYHQNCQGCRVHFQISEQMLWIWFESLKLSSSGSAFFSTRELQTTKMRWDQLNLAHPSPCPVIDPGFYRQHSGI